MKTVFTSAELPHVWAHQNAERGTCPASMSFAGPRLYSYGTCIGEITELKGKKIYLIDQTNYSVTTSGHQSAMRGAIPADAETLPVWGRRGNDALSPFYGYKSTAAERRAALKQWAVALFRQYLEEAGEATLSAKRRRAEWLRDSDLSEAARWLDCARRLNTLAGLRRKVPESGEGCADAIARAEKKAAAEHRKEQKRREKEAAENLEKWVSGDSSISTSSLPRLEKIFFRVVERGGARQIETSRGAFIPYEDGKKAFRFAIARRAKGWKRNGERFAVGAYQIDRVNTSGIVAGCHVMRWPEIEAFAGAQGWVN